LDSLRRKALFIDIVDKNGYLHALGYKDSLLPNAVLTQSILFSMKLTQLVKVLWTRYFTAEGNAYLYKVFPCRDGFMLKGHRHDSLPK
jgi:hypothetical protein